jgi:hypothetical protein
LRGLCKVSVSTSHTRKQHFIRPTLLIPRYAVQLELDVEEIFDEVHGCDAVREEIATLKKYYTTVTFTLELAVHPFALDR